MKTDVVVCGGGVVGSTLACILAQEGFAVTVVEARVPGDQVSQQPDPRVSAITRASENILRSLGVWTKIPDDKHQAFRKMCVWDRANDGDIEFDAADIAEPHLGSIVENHRLQSALDERLTESTNVSCLRPAQIDSFIVGSDMQVTLTGKTLNCDLLVGADGANSTVRQLAHIETRSGSYEQVAIVAIVECVDGHQDTAWQRFLRSGPIAVLPMYQDYACIVWSNTAAEVEQLQQMTSRQFDEALQLTLGERVGELRSVGKRLAFSLHWAHAQTYLGERVVLIGDAAHTIHPLAGQGVNLGIYDAAVLAQVMCEARRAGRDPSCRKTLRKYERWRRGHNQLMQTTMSGFATLFGSQNALLDGLRNLGLNLTNRTDPLKRLIMRQASGLAGDLPARARLLR